MLIVIYLKSQHLFSQKLLTFLEIYFYTITVIIKN